MKRKTKQTLKTIALAVVGVGALIGGASAINSLVNKADEDLKVIHPTFEVGGLTDEGKYEDVDDSIYTKEAFECQGLEIKLDFDNTIDYQVFFYESDGDFVSATETLSGNKDLEVPFGSTHARIEITPNWTEMGEDYDTEKEQVIKWYDVAKYSSQMEIKVNKVQEEIVLPYEGENRMVYFEGKTGTFSSGVNGFNLSDGELNITDLIITNNCSNLCLKVDENLLEKLYIEILGADTEIQGTTIGSLDYEEVIVSGHYFITLNLPTETKGICLFTLDNTIDFSNTEIYVW